MRNRAKCKLCLSLIESFSTHDFVRCSCGEIFVDGGQSYLRCGANDFKNFIRVEDDGTEKEVTFVPFDEKIAELEAKKKSISPNKEVVPEIQEKKEAMTLAEHLAVLGDMIKHMEVLPEGALFSPSSQYDHLSLLIWLNSFSTCLSSQLRDLHAKLPASSVHQ